MSKYIGVMKWFRARLLSLSLHHISDVILHYKVNINRMAGFALLVEWRVLVLSASEWRVPNFRFLLTDESLTLSI